MITFIIPLVNILILRRVNPFALTPERKRHIQGVYRRHEIERPALRDTAPGSASLTGHVRPAIPDSHAILPM